MTTQSSYQLWAYDLVWHVPYTPPGGGDIAWQKRTDLRLIYLPADVQDPLRYLSDSCAQSDADVLEYQFFRPL